MINEATESAYAKTIRVMFSGMSVDEGLGDLADYFETIVPYHTWASLRDLASNTRQAEFTEWLGKRLDGHPAGIDILWFSLSDTGNEIALCLLRRTRVPTDEHDWTAYEQVAAIDLAQEVLQPLNEVAQTTWADAAATDSSTRWIIETCVPPAWLGLLVGTAMRQLPTTTLRGSDSVRRVAAFFGQGDDFFLGEINAEGFSFFEPPTSEAV